MTRTEAKKHIDGMLTQSQKDIAILGDLRALEKNCPDLDRLESLLRQFNVFRVLRCEDGEIRHSNMLAWLLQPDESHGLGDSFLRRWLQRVVGDSEPEKYTGLSTQEIAKCKIREVEVTREWNHLDVLVQLTTDEHGTWIIAIENKVRAKQKESQLARYRKRVDSAFPKARRTCIFLTERDEQPEDQMFLPAKHRQVYEVLRTCIDKRKGYIGKEPRMLMRHYLGILEERCMEDTTITKLAQKIYEQHRLALDLIIEHRTKPIRLLTNSLAKQIKASGKRCGLIPMVTAEDIARFLPQKWNTTGNRSGHEWDEIESAYVLIEVGLGWGPHPWLEVVVSKCPHKKWRRELYDISQDKQFPIEHWNKGTKDDWMRIYSVKCPIRSNLDKLKAFDGKAMEIWDWCRETMKKLDFQRVARIVAAHLKKLPAP